MKKHHITLTVVALMTVLLIAGCGTFFIDVGGDKTVESVTLGGATVNENSTVTKTIHSYASSRHNITNLSPRTLTFPDQLTVDLSMATGGNYKILHYYFGTTPTDHKTMNDPFTETVNRQLYTVRSYHEPIAGEYRVRVGRKTKLIDLPQTNYLPVIQSSDIHTLAPAGYLYTHTGDTITLNNQTNPHYRYLCRIYDTQLDMNTFDRYWTSVDVRNLSWLKANELRSFFTSTLQAPHNGQVQFTIPAGILRTGDQNLTMYITAYDSSAVTSHTGGDFSSLTLPKTEIILYLSGQ